MSTQTERQHARYLKRELERHLRDTLERFGETIEAQADECREELAFALAETGTLMTSSAPLLRARLREHAGRSDGEEPQTRGTQRGRRRVPGSHVEVSRQQTLRGLGFIRPPAEEGAESAVPPEERDPQAA